MPIEKRCGQVFFSITPRVGTRVRLLLNVAFLRTCVAAFQVSTLHALKLEPQARRSQSVRPRIDLKSSLSASLAFLCQALLRSMCQ